MLKYTLKRFGIMLLTIWVIVTITFFIMHLMPGDPFTGEKVIQPDILENMKAKYGLDKPLIVQYTTYMGQLLKFDLGDSFKFKARSVNTILNDGFLKASGPLGFYSILFGAIVGISFGIIAALHRGKFFDYFVIIIAVLGVSVPNFVFATLFQYFFAFKLGELWKAWFDVSSGPFPIALWGTPMHYVLPALALGASYIAYIARMMRTSMLDVIGQDYIRTAKAKGLSQRAVIWKHAIRNAILPIVTIMGVAIAGVVVGSLVVENIFAITGMAKYFVESIMGNDYMMIMGTTIFYAIILIIMMFLIDILYGVVDPRIRLD